MRRVLVTEVEFPGEEWTRGLKSNVLRIDAAERHRGRRQFALDREEGFPEDELPIRPFTTRWDIMAIREAIHLRCRGRGDGHHLQSIIRLKESQPNTHTIQLTFISTLRGKWVLESCYL